MAKTKVVFSGNAKTNSRSSIPRPIVSTSRTADTCAPSCPFKGTGINHMASEGGTSCYPARKNASGTNFFERAENTGETDTSRAMKRIEIQAPPKAAVRHLVSGDVGNEGDDYIQEANKLHEARPDLQGWGYTHNWEHLDPNDVQGWELNASVETPKKAEEAIGRGWNVALVSPKDQTLAGSRIAGRRVVTCPAELDAPKDRKVGCADCHLCRSSGPNRPIVEFPAHGNSTIVGKIVTNVRQQEAVTASSSPDGDSTDNDAAGRNSKFVAGFNDQ